MWAAGAADPAPGGTEDDGAGGGNGPELTTPLGVSTGVALAVGRVGALGRGEVVLVPAAPAGALGCEEQLTSADSSNNDATYSSTRFGLLMPQH